MISLYYVPSVRIVVPDDLENIVQGAGMVYLDSETCGLHGLAVLLQYAVDDGPVKLHSIWEAPAADTMELIERIVNSDVCGFNLAFDWFHLCKLYTTFSLLPDLSVYPEDHIDEIAILEEKGRYVDLCLKPNRALDIMLHARKGVFQSLMDRDDIRIRRVPTALANVLAEELERRITFEDIYFAKSKDPHAPRWRVHDIKKSDGTINPDFKDIKLRFRASSGLKNLYRHAFGIKDGMLTFGDVEPTSWPEEKGYAPFALAIGKPGQWNGAWPVHIQEHIIHWGHNRFAQKYAADDVNYLRRLHHEIFNDVEPGDDDSELACLVAAARWRGFAVDLEKVKNLRTVAWNKIYDEAGNKRIATDPTRVYDYISEAMDEEEKLTLQFQGTRSTKKVLLEEVAKWKDDSGKRRPSAIRAEEVLAARKSIKKVEICDKLLLAKRFHASFSVIATKSNRMGGADRFNPQGIDHTIEVRAAFPLADCTSDLLAIIGSHLGIDDPNRLLKYLRVLCGGDFKSQEVAIAAAVFKDPELDKVLLEGRKIHAIMGSDLSGLTYEEVIASEGTEDDWYWKGKQGVFLLIYGGDSGTFKRKLGVALEIGEAAFQKFLNRFKEIKKRREQIHFDFCALAQPRGIGTKVEWHEPKQFVETAVGFKRYFTLEHKITRALFELAQSPPQAWKDIQIKVLRRDRIQTASGAVASALYAAAFGIAGAVVRAAMNHYIQSFGASVTKKTQRAIWDIQPCGIHEWIVQPMNIHDEIECPTKPGYQDLVKSAVETVINYFKPMIPFIAIDWVSNIPNWAGKKGNQDGVENEGLKLLERFEELGKLSEIRSV